MIPKNRRIKTALFRSSLGKTFRGKHLQVRIRKVDDTLPSRFAGIVSKKTAKTAVLRNAIRRKVYIALNPLLPRITPGFLCFLYPSREVEVLSIHELKKELQTIFQEAAILS